MKIKTFCGLLLQFIIQNITHSIPFFKKLDLNVKITLTVTLLLNSDKTKIINEHKTKRIDAQYYMKVDQEGKERVIV